MPTRKECVKYITSWNQDRKWRWLFSGSRSGREVASASFTVRKSNRLPEQDGGGETGITIPQVAERSAKPRSGAQKKRCAAGVYDRSTFVDRPGASRRETVGAAAGLASYEQIVSDRLCQSHTGKAHGKLKADAYPAIREGLNVSRSAAGEGVGLPVRSPDRSPWRSTPGDACLSWPAVWAG